MIPISAQKLKIGMYSPYLSILGGGEKYFTSIAECLSEISDVTIFSDTDVKEPVLARFGIDLKKVKFLPEKYISKSSMVSKFKTLMGYDVFFYMTDGSVFLPSAKRNFLIIQSPSHMPATKPVESIKTSAWRILCYSQFMKTVIESRLHKPAYILSPGIDTSLYSFKPKKKKPIILTVGRFFAYPHDKKQQILVDTFKEHALTLFKGWKLIVAGGLTEKSGHDILRDLKKSAVGYPIEFKVNIDLEELSTMYEQATFYWHAAGYGEDLLKNPERAEHFGITTLEAMASGCIPVVFDGGGQRDIVREGDNGYLWKTPLELVRKTMKAVDDTSIYSHLSSQAVARAKDFSMDVFYENIKALLK
jgi:glycosyltransferase involved in cell wall biosynthesis